MKKNELKEKTLKTLFIDLKKAREELFGMRMDHTKKKLKNTSSLSQKKKEIAQIMTYVSIKKGEK